MKSFARLKSVFSLSVVGGALLAMLAAAPFSSAQTTVTTWAQSYGVGSYDANGAPVTGDNYGSGTDLPTSCVAMPDGGVVIAGGLDLPELYANGSGSTGPSGSATTALVRYAADGHILWQQVFRQDNDEYNGTYNYSTFHLNRVDQMLADAQGNLFLRMVKDPGAVAGPSATVAKLAPDGTLRWQTGYSGDIFLDGVNNGAAGTGSFTSMSLTADGGVVVTGGEGSGFGTSQPYFAKINADGSLGAHRPFVNNGQYDSAGAAAQSADGTHFIVAMNAYGAVVLTDASGSILAERSFSNDANLAEGPSHILANTDGTYTMLTVGLSSSGAYVFPTGYLVRKLAADLTPIWEKVITNVTPGGTLQRANDGGYLLTSLNDGSAITSGQAGSTGTDVCVLHLDANGNLASAFVVGGPAAEGAFNVSGSPINPPTVTQTTDGGYGLTTASLSYHLPDTVERPDWWVVKTNASGQVTGFPGLMKPVVPVTYFNAHDNTTASAVSSHYAGFPPGYTTGAAAPLNPEPMFVIQDLGAKTGINHPTALFQAAAATGPATGNLIVPGTANLWLAGQANGVTASQGSDSVPAEAPILVTGLTLTAGQVLTFSATGGTAIDPGYSPDATPDGDGNNQHAAENGISSLVAPTDALIGVFLGDATPVDPAPDGGTPVGGLDYASFQPALGQAFFIGDGKDSTGKTQQIITPAGATRLYLGSMDNYGWYNNIGSFTVTVNVGATSTSGGSLIVPGTANPFLAGLPDGTTASGGDDAAPAQSPVLVLGLTLHPNKPLNFSVGGSVSTDATVQPTEGPDGGYFFAHNAENSFTKTVAPINSLVGVFLSDAAPDPTVVNDQVRDFSDAASTNGGVNFTGYQPDLGKPFFIGDGRTSAGIMQNVYPPAGATRLFLGVLDGNDYFNNLGQFNVGVSQVSDIDTDDLRLGQSVTTPTDSGGASALIGDRITYTFHVKNEGSQTFTNVQVKDVLPGVCEFVSASDGGTFQGGIVTWNLATLASTGSSTSKDLTLVVKTFSAGDSSAAVSAAQINQVINNSNYFLTGDGLPQTIVGQDFNNATTLLSPVSATFTSNSAAVAPGQTLMYAVDLHNTTSAKVKGVTFSVALPTALKNPTYYFVDANGVRLTDLDANVSLNGTLLTFNVGNLKPNQDARLVINGYVPFDASPSGDFALTSGQLVTKTSDSFGQNSFGVLAPATKLTGATVAPPALTLAKVIPDGPSLVTFFKLSPKFAKKAQALLPGAMFFKSDASGKSVLDDAAVAAFGSSLNPSTGQENDDDGVFTTVALPKPGKPAPTVNVALFYSNSGGADALNLVLRDPVPEGFTYLDGSALLNGKYGKPVPVSLENNGRLLVISAGKVKAGDSGLLLYTLTLNANPPAAGAIAPTNGAQLVTSGLTNSVNAFPDGPDLLLVGNFFVQADPSLPNGTNIPVDGVVTYDLLYTNTGGKAAKDFQVTCTVPAGTQFVRALPLNLDRSEPAGGDSDLRVSRPAPDATSGQIVFKLGKLGLRKQGRVRVQYKLTAAQLAKGLPDVPNPFVISDGPAPATALAEAHRVARGLQPARNPRPRADGADSSVTTTPVARILDPTVPRLFIAKTVPMVVEPGKTFDYLTTVGNLADVPFGDVTDNKSNGFVSEQLPADLQFVSIAGNDDTVQSPAHADANNVVIYTVPPLPPHSSATIKITVQPKASALGKTLAIPASHLSVLSVADDLFSGALTTRVVEANQLKVASADITGAAVARFNATAASVPNVAGNLTYKSVHTSVVGADDVTFTNGALLIPLGNGQAFLSGSRNAVGTTGGASYTGSSAGTLAFSTAADQLYVHDLIGKLPGGQTSVVLTAAGRDAATILREIDSSNAASVVAKGGANPCHSGALNLFGAIAGTFVSNDPAPPPPQSILSTLLPPGGLALAAGIGNTTLATLAGTLPADGSLIVTPGGNLVAQGGGNLVAQGGGNVVSNDGGSLVAQGGGNLQPIGSSQGTASLIGNDGGGLVSDGGSGLITQDGGGLISNDGGGLIGNDGGG